MFPAQNSTCKGPGEEASALKEGRQVWGGCHLEPRGMSKPGTGQTMQALVFILQAQGNLFRVLFRGVT